MWFVCFQRTVLIIFCSLLHLCKVKFLMVVFDSIILFFFLIFRYGGAVILLCLCHLLFKWTHDIHVFLALLLSQVIFFFVLSWLDMILINGLRLFFLCVIDIWSAKDQIHMHYWLSLFGQDGGILTNFLFCVFSWMETKSRLMQKKEQDKYPAILTNKLGQ